MWFPSFLRSRTASSAPTRSKRPRQSPRGRRAVALQVEQLEHRWCPSYSLVTSRAALAGTDSVNWGTLGTPPSAVANPFTILSTAGQSITVSKKISGDFAFETAFKVNFAPGDIVLDTEGPPNAGGNGDNNITLNFGATLIAAGGAQIASDLHGSFTAQIQALDASGHTLASFTEAGNTTYVLDNSAIFLGISSTSASISQIAISLTKVPAMANKALFSINQFDFRTSALAPVTPAVAHAVSQAQPAPTAASPASGLYIGDASDDTVKLFNENSGASLGTFVTSGSGGLHGPRGLLFDPAGNLLVSNQNVNLPIPGAILRFDGSTGALDNAPVPATDPHAPFAPRGIILGPSNTLYVADIVAPDNISDGKIEVYQYDPSTGTAVFQKDITHPAGFSGQFHPRGILFGPDGNLYVSVRNIPDPTGGAVLKFDPTGNFLGVFVASDVHNDLNRPEGLVFGPDGNLYVTSFRKDPSLANDTDKIEIFSGPNNPNPGSFLGEIDLDHQGMARAFGQALLFGPGGNLFVPITAGDPSFVGEVREYDVSTKTFTVFVPPASAGGPLGQRWYLTFAETNPTTLAFGEEDAPALATLATGAALAGLNHTQATEPLQMIITVPGTVSGRPQATSTPTSGSPAAIRTTGTDVVWRSVPTSARPSAVSDRLFADWDAALFQMAWVDDLALMLVA